MRFGITPEFQHRLDFFLGLSQVPQAREALSEMFHQYCEIRNNPPYDLVLPKIPAVMPAEVWVRLAEAALVGAGQAKLPNPGGT